jgi:hypothetical protein
MENKYNNIFLGGSYPKIEVWFLDRSLRWHYLAESFMAYFRLMLMHLGLPQWQYGITDIGLSQQAQVRVSEKYYECEKKLSTISPPDTA